MTITICGSYKFTATMFDMYKFLTDMGHMVFLPAIGCNVHDKNWYLNLHFKKIAASDAIFVVDVNGYIGESTRSEIAKAIEYKKKIFYYSKIIA